MNRTLPPRYTVPTVWRDAITGASQSKRYGGSPAGGRGVMPIASPVIGSTSERLPLLDDEYTLRQSALSTALPVPSLKPISTQSWLRMPSQCRVALGPMNEWLSCSPAYTQYGSRLSTATR